MGVAAFAAAAATGASAPRATTAGTTATAAARATAAATTAAAGGLRVGDLDRDPTAIQLAAVQLGDRVLRLLSGGHLDEAEAPRLPGKAIRDHRGRENVA